MRFLVDESLPRAVTRCLAAAGHDVIDARDVGLRGALDDQIASRASTEGRIVVSGDLDFANALRFPPGTHPGMVVARMPAQVGPDALAERIRDAIDEAGAQVIGAITVVEPGRVRIFKEP